MRTSFWGRPPPTVYPHSRTTGASDVQLVVEPLAHTQWRVCDSRWPERDPQHLLGFIELTNDAEFEVMSLAHGFEWFTYVTLDEATAHFLEVTHEGAPVSADAHALVSAALLP